jgi:DNA-binding transcriptional LysR family regulator
VRSLGVEEFVIAVPRDDPLAARRAAEIDLAALSGRRWVHYAPGNGLAEILDRACSNAGFQPAIAVRTEQTASAPVLAAAGLGPALIPAGIVPKGYEGYTLKPVPRVTRELTAYGRTALDALSGAFLATLVATTGDGPLRPP